MAEAAAAAEASAAEQPAARKKRRPKGVQAPASDATAAAKFSAANGAVNGVASGASKGTANGTSTQHGGAASGRKGSASAANGATAAADPQPAVDSQPADNTVQQPSPCQSTATAAAGNPPAPPSAQSSAPSADLVAAASGEQQAMHAAAAPCADACDSQLPGEEETAEGADWMMCPITQASFVSCSASIPACLFAAFLFCSELGSKLGLEICQRPMLATKSFPSQCASRGCRAVQKRLFMPTGGR